jgi:hypothetical protein
VPLQLLAAWWGFSARSAAAATGSAVLTAAWLAFAVDLVVTPLGTPGPSNALGLLLLAAAAALLAPLLASLRSGALLPGVVLATAAARFVLTGVSGETHRTWWAHASGWVGIAVAAVALYASIALELEGTAKQPVLPTFRVARARTAMAGSFGEQLDSVEHEAGVRSTV